MASPRSYTSLGVVSVEWVACDGQAFDTEAQALKRDIEVMQMNAADNYAAAENRTHEAEANGERLASGLTDRVAFWKLRAEKAESQLAALEQLVYAARNVVTQSRSWPITLHQGTYPSITTLETALVPFAEPAQPMRSNAVFCREFAAHFRKHPNAAEMSEAEQRAAGVALMCFSNYLNAREQGLRPEPNITPDWFPAQPMRNATEGEGA